MKRRELGFDRAEVAKIGSNTKDQAMGEQRVTVDDATLQTSKYEGPCA